MAKVRIWRVAHKDTHCGPYESCTLDGEIMDHRPLPHNDGLRRGYKANPNWRFGFTTLTQLKNWFDDEYEHMLMHNRGVRVQRIEVDEKDIRFGNSQIVFRAGKERIINQRTFRSIL